MPPLPTTISMQQPTFPKMQSVLTRNIARFLLLARRTIRFVPPMPCVIIFNRPSFMSRACLNREENHEHADRGTGAIARRIPDTRRHSASCALALHVYDPLCKSCTVEQG